MFKWIARLLGGPDKPGEATDTEADIPASAEIKANTAPSRIKPTVTLPKEAPRPDIAALQAKFAKDPKKHRRHDKRGRGPKLPKFPNGISSGKH